MGVETDTGECEKVNTELSVSSQGQNSAQSLGLQRSECSSQGEQALPFTPTSRVLPHLDHSDSRLESSNHSVCELPKSESPQQLHCFVTQCLAIASLPLCSFVHWTKIYRDMPSETWKTWPASLAHRPQIIGLWVHSRGAALTVHGVFTHASLEPGSRGNILAGVTASIDRHTNARL